MGIVLRSRIRTTIIALVILACFLLPAYAYQPYTCSYTLKASSPIDDPSTSPIEASPGSAIDLKATVTGTYSGPISLTLPAFDVNLGYDLKHDGVSIDSKRDSYPVNSMKVDPGRTYSQTGGKAYVLPSGIAPGDYTLDCTAEISLLGIGKTERASFLIKIGAPARASTGAGSITPASENALNTDGMDPSASSPNDPIKGTGSSPEASQGPPGLNLDPIGILQLVIDGLRQIL